MRWHHWAIFAFGTWLLITPWLFGFSQINLASWNNVALGALIMVFVLWNLEPPEEE